MSISTANPQLASFTKYRYVAVGAETSVSGVDANGNVLSYNVGLEQVYLNGVMLVRNSDYTATTGTSITALAALTVNDIVEILTFTTFVIADAVSINGGSTITVASGSTTPLTIQNNGTGNSFVVNDIASDTTPFIIDASGNVGIGTSTPLGNLGVYSSSNPSIAIQSSGANGFFTAASDKVDIRAYLSPGGTSDVISLTTGTTERMRIDSSGNVGIGKTPTAPLDVNGSINSTNYSMAGKNVLINGAMDIWQRGTIITTITNSSAYTADRWYGSVNAVCATNYSRQVTGDTTNLPNIQYCMRVQRTSGQTATPYIFLSQSVETVNSIPYAGKMVTLSFYARAGANFSAASAALGYVLYSGTGTDQNVGVNAAGYTGAVTVTSAVATLTTTWQRFTVTGTPGATATELAISFNYLAAGTAGVNDYFEVTGVQLEVGSVATPFSRSNSTFQSELSTCQRYYYRNTPGAVTKTLGPAFATATTSATLIGQFPVTMRTAPSALEQVGTATRYAVLFGVTTTQCSVVPAVSTQTTDTHYAVTLTVASGLTVGQGGRAVTDATGGAIAYLGWSAEL
jgi:hypothetical protein